MHNIRSLKTNKKFDKIETIPKIHNRPQVIAFTETWLDKNIEKSYQLNI